MAAVYELINLRQEYAGRTVLNIPQLQIEEDTVIGLIGPNGCGKSTLLRLLAFLETPLEGSLRYNSRSGTSDLKIMRQEVTLLMQEPYLFKFSVFENVAYGLRLRRDVHRLAKRVAEALAMVGLDPGKFARRKWYELSGGEARRVSLASRLILEPRVLLLDEPTAGVDGMNAELIKVAVQRCHENHTTIIVSSHDLFWLNNIADELYQMQEGLIVGSAAENIIPGPWHLDASGLFARRLSNGEIIYVKEPPSENAAALLSPAVITVADKHPDDTSARNVLTGRIENLALHKDGVMLNVRVAEQRLACLVTEKSAAEFKLLPGKKVWLIFKASALRWGGHV